MNHKEKTENQRTNIIYKVRNYCQILQFVGEAKALELGIMESANIKGKEFFRRSDKE